MNKIIFSIGLLLVIVFLGPLIVMVGWNCARELWPTLPEATYWQIFWISNAISLTLKSTFNINNES